MREQVISRILDCKIIAIIRGVEPEKCLKLAKALYEGGIELIEVTFNQLKPAEFSVTADAIRAISDYFGGRVQTGAGTVTTPALVDRAAAAGARYVISPNTDGAVIKRTRELGLVSIPGAMTPTEILAAHNAGADFVKLFPASDLGTGYLKAVSTPINQVRFIAAGGVTEKNLHEYIGSGAVAAGISGRLVNKDWIDSGEFGKITAAAKEYTAAAAHCLTD